MENRLSIEAKEALAAGMSYGKWKAMQWQPEEKKPEEEQLPEYVHICLNCGAKYERFSKRRMKFCCALCRDAYNHRKYYQSRKERKQNECLQVAGQESGQVHHEGHSVCSYEKADTGCPA